MSFYLDHERQVVGHHEPVVDHPARNHGKAEGGAVVQASGRPREVVPERDVADVLDLLAEPPRYRRRGMVEVPYHQARALLRLPTEPLPHLPHALPPRAVDVDDAHAFHLRRVVVYREPQRTRLDPSADIDVVGRGKADAAVAFRDPEVGRERQLLKAEDIRGLVGYEPPYPLHPPAPPARRLPVRVPCPDAAVERYYPHGRPSVALLELL